MKSPIVPSQPETKSSSRRALLAGALGGIGAFAAGALARVAPTRAADGQTVLVGNVHEGINATQITKTSENQSAILGYSSPSTGSGAGVAGATLAESGSGVVGEAAHFDGPANGVKGSSASRAGTGVRGQATASSGLTRGVHGTASSPQGRGVFGNATAATGLTYGVYGSVVSPDGRGVFGYGAGSGRFGVYGQSNAPDGIGTTGHGYQDSTGVLGYSGSGSAPPGRAATGVHGVAKQGSTSRGVVGESTSGQGVRGEATSGSGLYATATSGYAIRGRGRIRLEKVSGVATIPKGATSVTVSPGVNVTSGSFVLLTPKAKLGGRDLWYTTNATANTFTIRLSSGRSAGTKVAWLLLG